MEPYGAIVNPTNIGVTQLKENSPKNEVVGGRLRPPTTSFFGNSFMNCVSPIIF